MAERRRISRRRFLLLTGGGLGACALTFAGASALYRPAVSYAALSCGEGVKMQKVLVAYATKCGSTGEVAEAIGQVLCQRGAAVDVLRVQDVRDLSGYSAVIIGGASRMGKMLPEAVKFAEKQRSALARVPTAYFTVGTTMCAGTPEKRAEAEGYLAPLRAIKEPVGTGLFAGKVDHSKIELPWRLLVSMDKTGDMREGDWRDWDAIRGWAKELSVAFAM